MKEPLEGVKVIDLTYFVAGPGTARILADWGADVIKVEPAFGDPGRHTGAGMTCPDSDWNNPFYTTYNAGKRGLSVNLKTPEGKEIMGRLLQTAQVLVTSYRTQALKRLGLDYESLRESCPHLIWAQVNGFGDYGPAKDNPGFDTVAYWARSGAMMDIAEKDTNPINPPIAFGDSVTSCSLAGGICAALYRQQKTGLGGKVEVSLFGQAIWNVGALIASTQHEDVYPKSRKEAISPVINSYQCKDGKWIFLSILEHERYFGTLCTEVLGRGDLAEDERFAGTLEAKRHAAELIQILDGEFARYTQDEIVDRLTKADIAHERIQHVKDVLKDEQALANQYLICRENRDKSRSLYASTPVHFDGADIRTQCDAPLIGQDSREILGELGYKREEIEAWMGQGIVAAPV